MKPALYVYGIVDSGALEAPPRATGVDGRYHTTLFEVAGLTAIVSEVDVTEFEGDALERNASRPDWLEAKVRGHESVLDEIVAKAAVVPMRFGSIFSTADGLKAMLVEHEPTLKRSLDGVRGRSEWGVKVYCDRRSLIGQLAATGAPEEGPSGRNYLMQRKAQLQAEADAAATASRIATDINESLAGRADGAVSMGSRGGGAQSTVILNGAYLVREEGREAFMQRVEELQDTHSDAYVFEVTGPWPPYNFTSADVAGPRT